ncbi:uncharacterized protein LOC129728536 [Wyeomyia smithii]|uniref:uncharacterized protein LOC129728536 n=1 Tax=Wyeomyia smithii TaxID=174621 RepID=UPI002467C30E|nr:uncharacterized protein LOC129728536 [Wyeomyia smithii]
MCFMNRLLNRNCAKSFDIDGSKPAAMCRAVMIVVIKIVLCASRHCRSPVQTSVWYLVKTHNLRGCLRILVTLSRKGVKSQAGIECWRFRINQNPFQNNLPNTSHGI